MVGEKENEEEGYSQSYGLMKNKSPVRDEK